MHYFRQAFRLSDWYEQPWLLTSASEDFLTKDTSIIGKYEVYYT